MKTSLLALSLLVLTLASTGCVSQGHADDQREVIRTLQDRIVELESTIEQLNTQIDLMRGRGADYDEERAELVRMRDEAVQRMNELLAENERLRNRAPEERVIIRNQLPEELSDALKDFAAANPGIAEYDESRGVVQLRSDLTFGLGSADLSAAAKATIPQLAQVLTTPAARNYEVQVVGHTDAVPISKASTKQKHPTNWHLSVHRAISVRDALTAAGIPDLRTSVAGYGKYRPIVQNAARGAEPNRRVEIYLKPMAAVNEQFIDRANVGGGAAQGGGNAGNDDGPEPGEVMFK
jgi:chemotaxis protein MotB